MHKYTTDREDDLFEDHERAETKMIGLGFIELISIIGVGAYQFWVLKNHIQEKVF